MVEYKQGRMIASKRQSVARQTDFKSQSANVTSRHSNVRKVLAQTAENMLSEDGELGDLNEKYEIGRTLGEGAFGVVSECWLKGSSGKTKYALKKIGRSDNMAEKKIQMRELLILKQVLHPNIMRVFDICYDSEMYYIVTELMAGGDLRGKLGEYKNIQNVADDVYEVLYALRYMHDINMVHCDIKSDNVLMSSEIPDINHRRTRQERRQGINFFVQDCKLADFGLTQYLDPNGPGLENWCGTPDYLSPELVKMSRGERGYYNEKVDIWAVGVMVWAMLVGHTPFDGVDQWGNFIDEEEMKDNILYNEPDFCFEAFGWVSGPAPYAKSNSVQDFIMKCLIKNPADRWSVAQLMEHEWIKQNKPDNSGIQRSHTVAVIQQNAQLFAHPELYLIPAWAQRLLVQGTWMEMNEQDIHEAAIIWNMIDANDNGTVCKSEVEACFKEMCIGFEELGDEVKKEAKRATKSVWSTLDADNSGVITFDEFLPLTCDPDNFMNKEMFINLFQLKIQCGENGNITQEDFKKLFTCQSRSADKGNGIENKIWEGFQEDFPTVSKGNVTFNDFWDRLSLLYAGLLEDKMEILRQQQEQETNAQQY